MRKNKMGAIALGLASIVAITSCGNSNGESVKTPSTISYDQLKMMAVEPTITKGNDYKSTTFTKFTYDATTTKINCLDSIVGVTSEGYLKNLIEDEYTFGAISSLYSSGLRDNTGYFSSNNGYRASSYYPFVLFTTLTDTNKTLLNIVDNAGYSVTSFLAGKTYYIQNINSKKFNGFTYVNITFQVLTDQDVSTLEVYLKYKFSNGEYTITETNYDEYSYSSSSNSVDKYNDGLSPYYNSKGDIVCYMNSGTEDIYIYNENKEFLNSFRPASFGMDKSNYVFFNESLFFYKNVEYYPSELEKGSEKKYKNECLEIDLTDGKVSYNEDFKYYIQSATTETDLETGNFKYSIVNYYELNEDRTRSKILKSVIVSDNLGFDDSFIYEGNYSSVIKIDDKSVLAYLDGSYYIVSKDNRILLKDITEFKFLENGIVTYKNKQDNLYYMVKLTELRDKYQELNSGYGYISTNTYSGSHVACKYVKSTNSYTYGSISIKPSYLDLLEYNIIVNKSCVYLGNTLVSTNNVSTTEVSSVSLSLSYGNEKVFVINYSNGDNDYFKVTYTI